MAQANYIGRRKTSTARLYIKPGKGEFIVNKLQIEEYLIALGDMLYELQDTPDGGAVTFEPVV